MFKKIKIILIIFFSILVLLIAGVYAILRSSSMQTILSKKIAYFLASELGTQIGIGGVDFRPFKTLVLEDFFILDLRQDTLVKMSKLYLDVDAFDRNSHHAVINKLQFENPVLNLKYYRNDSNLNAQFLFDYFHSEDSSSNWNALIGSIKIQNGIFRYVNENIHHQESQDIFDYNNLNLANIQLESDNFLINKDSIHADIQQLSLSEKCGFMVDSLSCVLQFFFGKVSINDLNLLTKNSKIEGDFSFKYNKKEDFNNFIKNIYLKSNFNKCKINTNDFAFFTNELKGINKNMNLSGSFNGMINNLKCKDLLIEFGEHSYLKGNLKLSGLPQIEETFIDLDVEKSQVTKSDLENYPMLIANAGQKVFLPENISKLGLIRFSGRFTGFIYDFVAKSSFKTSLGSFSSDLNMKISPEKNDAKYTGHISLNNFNIGTYLKINNIVEKISLTAKVEGKGLKFDNLVANINGHADEIALSNYTYKNCDINGTLSRRLFNGHLLVNDENLNLEFSGNVDLSQKIPQFDFTSEIKNANLVKQKLVDSSSYAYKNFGNLILNTSLNLKFSGENLENIHGKVIIDNTILITNIASHRISNINLYAGELKNGDKEILISSEIADASIKGKFELESIKNSLKLFLKNYLPSIYIDTARTDKNFQNFTFDVNMKNPHLFNELVIPLFEKEMNFKIPEDSYIKGFFDEQNKNFKLESVIKKISYKDVETENLNISIQTLNDSLLITTTFDKLSSPAFGMGISKVHVSFINNNFRLKSIAMKDTATLFHLNAKGSFYRDTIILIELLPSWVRFAGKNWHSDPYNSINVSNSVIDFNNIVFSYETQQISINGTVSDNLNEQINFNLSDFNLENLNEIFEFNDSSSVGGIANGNIEFSGLKVNPQFSGDFYVQNLSLSSNPLGNGNLNLRWTKNENKLFLNSSIKYEEMTTFFLNGYYNISEKNMDFDFNLSPVSIHVFDKIFLPNVSDLSGKFSSQIKITGTTDMPNLYGFVKLDDVEFTVNYLQTHYQVTDLIQIDGNKFIFNDVDLFDQNHNKCLANGYLSHSLFKDFKLNIEMDARKFEFLNTNEKDNTMYYGSGIGSGKVIFKGPLENPQIKIVATTEPGTKIFIPISDETELSEQKFVSFVQNKNKTDSTGFDKSALSGIQMDFQLEVTPDAEVQMIFDPTIGDIVKCYGNANLKMEVNSLGYFNMFGDYTLEKGDYLFTFKDVINKRFKVEQGGTIQWNGDPYNAKIKLEAIYKIRTQLLALMENNENMLEEEFYAYKKRVPIECLLKMSGALQSPDINFEIICKDNIPDLAKLELLALQNDQLEMNKQIFGLLALNRFLPKQSFDLTRGNAIGSNARELLSNQISNWVSQYRDDIDLGIYYHGQDSLSDFITSRELQVALTKRFFNDRLSVNIDGNFELGNTDAPTNDDKKYIIGDFTVEYKLSKDGRFKVKSFHKTYNDILGYNYTTKQGIGLFFKEEYDSITELRKTIKKREL